MKEADAELQKSPGELELVAGRLEEEIFEQVARVPELTAVELVDACGEAWVEMDWWKCHGSWEVGGKDNPAIKAKVPPTSDLS